MVNQTLVIVESPGKIKKINAILGKDYLVKASVGHIRDLESSKLSIDVNNDFKPTYIVSKDKKQVVSDLKNCVKKCNDVILAADEDREGEAIAASLAEVLKLKDPKRIVFNEITKDAIESAIRNPGKINYNLVRAQETRRFLDRIVGFKLSPLLWKNVMNKLSAGRVQSVVVKLIIEKEDNILNLKKESYFKISGVFHSLENENNKLSGVLYEMDKSKKSKGYLLKLTDKSQVEKLMTILDKSKYEVKLIENKISKRNPQPPFITSTLQQEANKKFNFTIKSTMNIAQKLYEGGHITYMRTDSTNLSDEALKSCEKYVKSKFGSKYYCKRKYNSKSKNAQEAHEAIRPTKLDKENVDGSGEEKKLYSLIWKRTIASQMSSAEISINNIYVEIMHNNLLPYYFLSTNESIKFDGFLKVYNVESEELSKCNINFKEKDKLEYDEIIAKEEFTKGIGRYNEATLVKKLEELSIGRPSTYASIISKIQERNYVEKVDIEGEKVKISKLEMKNGKSKKWKEEDLVLGKEKQKLVPTEIGRTVNIYLEDNFNNIMDYKFTAKLEDDLDKIVDSELNWVDVLRKFYDDLNPKVEKLLKEGGTSDKMSNNELLGEDLEGNKVYKSVTKYGPVVKLVNGDKVKYASVKRPLKLDKISLKEALDLLRFPKKVGDIDGKEVIINNGKFGLYLNYDGKNYPVSNENLSINEMREIIMKKNKNVLNEFKIDDKIYSIRDGKYGPYISYKKGKKLEFKSIPKSYKIKNLKVKDILDIINKKS
jgi:DNA topoisomerase-1